MANMVLIFIIFSLSQIIKAFTDVWMVFLSCIMYPLFIQSYNYSTIVPLSYCEYPISISTFFLTFETKSFYIVRYLFPLYVYIVSRIGKLTHT